MRPPDKTVYSITYHQAVEARACTESLDQMCEALGGDWGVYGRKQPIPLTRVLDVLGINDTLWAFDVVAGERVVRLVASDFAAHVHDVWDDRHPDDTRPGDAIRAVRGWDAGTVTEEERIKDARDAWDAGDARAARDAWDAGDARAARAAGAACAARAARAAGDAWAARAAGDARAAGAAGAAWAARAAWDARDAWDACAARAAGDAWAARAAGDARAAEVEWQTRYLRDVLSGRRVPGRVRIARAKGTRP